MDQPARRPTPRSNRRSRSVAGSSSKPAAGSISRSAPRPAPRPTPGPTPNPAPKPTSKPSAASTSRSAGNVTGTKLSAGSASFVVRELQTVEKEEEREVEVVFTGLPCTCKNCEVTFGSYHDYYCHLVYSPFHGPEAQPLDLELKLGSSSQLPVDLELRLRPPADE